MGQFDQVQTKAQSSADTAAPAKRHAQEAADDAKAMAAEKKHPGPYNDEFNTAVGLAGIAAAGLAPAQNRGLAIIKDETAAYHKLVEKAPRSIWWDLAEIALTVATAGVASHVAKYREPGYAPPGTPTSDAKTTTKARTP